ncbi:type VI secretion system accessory protein TagJ [Planctomycetota bacterium]|nr:type VI secretion system accessory protein TagJ [Planctomycetota bacterium]
MDLEMDLEELLQQALMKHRDGDIDGAGIVYHQILEIDSAFEPALLNLASLALDKQQVDPAKKLLMRVLAANEDSGPAHLLYSRVCFLQGNHEEGYPHIRAAFELLPDDNNVATEFVSAIRRAYFTFNEEEYHRLFGEAQEKQLGENELQRLTHMTFLRILRPELIVLLLETDLPADTPDAIMRWLQSLPEDSQQELAVLARNFVQAAELMQEAPLYQPQKATVTLRGIPDKLPEETREGVVIEDADTLTNAAIEIVVDGELKFIPFSEVKRIELNQPEAAMGAVVTRKDGQVFSGLIPLFYLLTEFSHTEKVAQGQSTLIRPLLPEVNVGIGMRVYRMDDDLMPLVRIESIEFED